MKTGLVDELRALETELQLGSIEEYHNAVRNSGEFTAVDLQQILSAAGKTIADFETDLNRYQQRIAAAATLEREDELREHDANLKAAEQELTDEINDFDNQVKARRDAIAASRTSLNAEFSKIDRARRLLLDTSERSPEETDLRQERQQLQAQLDGPSGVRQLAHNALLREKNYSAEMEQQLAGKKTLYDGQGNIIKANSGELASYLKNKAAGVKSHGQLLSERAERIGRRIGEITQRLNELQAAKLQP